MKRIPTRRLGENGPTVSAIGLGCMGMGAFYGRTDQKEVINALTYAADRGVTLWDTADIYGNSESILGEWFSQTGRREEIFLCTKFGCFDPEKKEGNGRQISKPSYIKYALERSLKNLKTDYIDLYYQHRVDPTVPVEVMLEALREPIEKGTIRWIGLSQVSAAELKRAKAVKVVGERVIATQEEFSPFDLVIEKNGVANAAKELGVAVVAYSPLARGLVTGRIRSRADFEDGDLRLILPKFEEKNFAKNLELTDKIKQIAEKYSATPSQVTLAWILAEHENFVPIPGCRTISRVEENAAAAELKLQDEDIKLIRELTEAAEVHGGAVPEYLLHMQAGDSLPLDQWKGVSQ